MERADLRRLGGRPSRRVLLGASGAFLLLVAFAGLSSLLSGEREARGWPIRLEPRAEAPPDLAVALRVAREGSPGRALSLLETASDAAAAASEKEILDEAARAMRDALAWRARVAAAASANPPRLVRVLPPGEAVPVDATVLAVELGGLRVRLPKRAAAVESLLPFEALSPDVLRSIAPGLADSSDPRTWRRVGILRLLRGAHREAAEAFARLRGLEPEADLALEAGLLGAAG